MVERKSREKKTHKPTHPAKRLHSNNKSVHRKAHKKRKAKQRISQSMSQISENDSDESDCEYFLQPTSNQYNITEKIKEANQSLFSKSETVQRQSQPKVRFRDHNLVDYEPEENIEIMDKQVIAAKKGEESSDDGYIDDETLETSSVVEERIIQESFEEVCEQIENSELREVESNAENDEDDDTEKYSKEAFIDEDDGESSPGASATPNDSFDKPPKKKSFRPKSSKVIPQETIDSTRSRSKTCCDYKETDEYKQKLPKYNGFNSHYGLSKEEIAKREFLQIKQQEYDEYRRSQQLEKKEFLAKVNEEAFSKWLHKKMRNSMMNKSNPINMFDVKISSRKRTQQWQAN